jgi:hypothetical protein
MRKIHEQFPLYNFEQHKGYGTAAHVAAIHRHGPCPYHRMTFAPLKNMAARASLKAASISKAGPTHPTPASASKRSRSTANATVGLQGPTAAAAASCESERTLRLRRRTERGSKNET